VWPDEKSWAPRIDDEMRNGRSRLTESANRGWLRRHLKNSTPSVIRPNDANIGHHHTTGIKKGIYPFGIIHFSFPDSGRGRGGDDIAGQADLALAVEKHGLVLARLQFAGTSRVSCQRT
jgi:hypothetical protein